MVPNHPVFFSMHKKIYCNNSRLQKVCKQLYILLNAQIIAFIKFQIYIYKKESKEDPRGPYADIRFYKNDSAENLQIYEMLLQALGNDIKVTKQGREYEISNTERDIKEELKKLEKEPLPIIHNKNRFPEED